MSHTKEPWSIHHRAPTFIRANDGKKHIGNTDTLGDENEDKANARRIVACVNACAGISDAGLMALAGTSILEKANASCDVVQKQRDDLLAALEYAIKQIPELGTVPGVVAAIASAKGGAA